MKILIADKFPDNYMEELQKLGHDVIFEPKLGENDLPEKIKDADVLIVRSTVVNAKTIENAQNLKIINRAGSGYNTIDVEAATKKGVHVTNCPGKNAIAVAELAMGLIISLDRRIPNNVMDFNNGTWNKAEYSKADGLFGKTLAVIGVGNIGREVATRAKAFGMKVYGMDIIKIEGLDIEYIDDLQEILSRADVVTLHLPSTPETKNLFNDEVFSYMKNGTILINTSRPQVIDEVALINAVKAKNLKVGLDVLKDEPEGKTGSVSSKLQNVDNIYVTHHIGASTQQAQDAVAEETMKIISTFAESGKVLNCVNK